MGSIVFKTDHPTLEDHSSEMWIDLNSYKLWRAKVVTKLPISSTGTLGTSFAQGIDI